MRQRNTEWFWRRVYMATESGCWEWDGRINTKSGYGQVDLDGKSLQSHRLAWIIFYGEIPDEMDVLHNCHNKTCCNPAHLRLGNDHDNSQDSDRAKLDWDKVTYAREAFAYGEKDQYELAVELDVTPGTISKLITNRSWKI